MYYGRKGIYCQYLRIKKLLFQDFAKTLLLHEMSLFHGNNNVEKLTRPRLCLICLCIVMRCIMNTKTFFVNTLPLQFHRCPLSIDASKYQTAVLSAQTKTILQADIHFSRAGCIGNIIQVTVRVRGLIIYCWMDDSFVYD
jgi:hypothetical protein